MHARHALILGTLLAASPLQVSVAEIIEQDGVRYRVERVEEYVAPRNGWEMLDALRSQPDGQGFAQAIEQVGLSQPLITEEGFTAFVPVDARFHSAAVPPGFLDPANPAAADFLSGHVVNRKININLIHGAYERFPTVAGTKVALHRVGDRVTVNGEPIVGAVKTPYGFIYYINGFVETPGDIATADNR